MIINHNLMAMNTHRQLGMNNTAGAKSLEKLSSGFRINRAGDDAAGLAISEKMRGQIRGLNQASRNAQDGISLIQTAEGALNESHAILQRMRVLAVQSATDTNTQDDRSKLQSEVDRLAEELTRISNTTEFNTRNLLAGGLSTVFHIGANEGQNVNSSIGAMDAYSLGVAGYQVSGGTFTAAGGLTTAANFGASLTTQEYKITTTVDTAAAIGAVAGAAGGTTGGAFVGDENINAQIKILTLSGTDGTDQVTSFSYSLDGGSNWTVVNAATGPLGTTGVTWTANADYDNSAGGAVNAVANFTLTAARYSAQLLDANDVAIGNKVTFARSATSAVIGNAATGETMKVSFAAGNVTASTDARQAIATVGSTAASIGANGEVSSKATVSAGVNISSQVAADKAITTINNALEKVSEERAKLGAMQNRLEHTIKNLDTSAENLQASEARIRDVDMAAEMMEFTKNSILQQAATAMLAQANMQPQAVLQLLR